jgi:hypothetical protein
VLEVLSNDEILHCAHKNSEPSVANVGRQTDVPSIKIIFVDSISCNRQSQQVSWFTLNPSRGGELTVTEVKCEKNPLDTVECSFNIPANFFLRSDRANQRSMQERECKPHVHFDALSKSLGLSPYETI